MDCFSIISLSNLTILIWFLSGIILYPSSSLLLVYKHLFHHFHMDNNQITICIKTNLITTNLHFNQISSPLLLEDICVPLHMNLFLKKLSYYLRNQNQSIWYTNLPLSKYEIHLMLDIYNHSYVSHVLLRQFVLL